MMCLAIFTMALMFIGSFTTEWTCHCEGKDNFKCKGEFCNLEASNHFENSRHEISCKRSDWPMLIVEKTFTLIGL